MRIVEHATIPGCERRLPHDEQCAAHDSDDEGHQRPGVEVPAEDLGAVAGVVGVGDVEQDLPGRARGADHSGKDAQRVMTRIHPPEQVHDGSDSEADHPGALHDAERTGLLPDPELKVQRTREHADETEERHDVDNPREEHGAIGRHGPAIDACRGGRSSCHVCP